MWNFLRVVISHIKLQHYVVTRALVSQIVKNLPAMQETRVQSLGREDPLEKGMATHSSSKDRGAWQAPVHGVAKNRTRLSDYHITYSNKTQIRRKLKLKTGGFKDRLLMMESSRITKELAKLSSFLKMLLMIYSNSLLPQSNILYLFILMNFLQHFLPPEVLLYVFHFFHCLSFQ